MEGDTEAGRTHRASGESKRGQAADDSGHGATGGDPGGETSPETSAGPPDLPLCDLCGARMVEHHCKITCPNCGYMRDCSDP